MTEQELAEGFGPVLDGAELRRKAKVVHQHAAVKDGILTPWYEEPSTVGQYVRMMLYIYDRTMIAGIHIVCGAPLGMERKNFPAQWLEKIDSTEPLSLPAKAVPSVLPYTAVTCKPRKAVP